MLSYGSLYQGLQHHIPFVYFSLTWNHSRKRGDLSKKEFVRPRCDYRGIKIALPLQIYHEGLPQWDSFLSIEIKRWFKRAGHLTCFRSLWQCNGFPPPLSLFTGPPLTLKAACSDRLSYSHLHLVSWIHKLIHRIWVRDVKWKTRKAMNRHIHQTPLLDEKLVQ